MLSLVIAQLCLGFTAFLTRVAWGHDAVQPELPMVISTVAHVAVGALLLATTVDPGHPGVAACSGRVRREAATGAAGSLRACRNIV